MTLKWRGDQVVSLINADMMTRVDAASRVIRDTAKRLVGRAQPYKIYGKKGSRSRKGLDPSRPGEPPKKLAGELRKGILKDMDLLKPEARVGTNVEYGKWLEMGTRNMAPRPWLSAALRKAAPRLMRRFRIKVKWL